MTSIRIRKPRNDIEIEKCAISYCKYSDSTFYPINEIVAVKNLKAAWRGGAFIRVIEYNKKIIGWILATLYKIPFAKEIALNQSFYFCSKSGYIAARAVLLSHTALVEYAETMRIPIVISHASWEDKGLVFTKILEKAGWSVKGYAAVFYTSHFKRKVNGVTITK